MPGASVTSGMFAGSVSMTTVLTLSRDLRRDGGDQRGEAAVHEQDFVLRMIDDVGDVVRVQARVDGVADRLHPRRGVVDLQMAIAVPGQRADAVAGADAQLLQHPDQSAGTRFDIAPGIAMGGVLVRAGHHLAGSMMARGMGQDRGNHQPMRLHQAEHGRRLRVDLLVDADDTERLRQKHAARPGICGLARQSGLIEIAVGTVLWLLLPEAAYAAVN